MTVHPAPPPHHEYVAVPGSFRKVSKNHQRDRKIARAGPHPIRVYGSLARSTMNGNIGWSFWISLSSEVSSSQPSRSAKAT